MCAFNTCKFNYVFNGTTAHTVLWNPNKAKKGQHYKYLRAALCIICTTSILSYVPHFRRRELMSVPLLGRCSINCAGCCRCLMMLKCDARDVMPPTSPTSVSWADYVILSLVARDVKFNKTYFLGVKISLKFSHWKFSYWNFSKILPHDFFTLYKVLLHRIKIKYNKCM